MSPDTDRRFWDFSFEEFGGFDLKSVIEFIKSEKRSQDKISLVGYSEGTTSSFYATAEDPAYYKKNLNLFVALAPCVIMKDAGNS